MLVETLPEAGRDHSGYSGVPHAHDGCPTRDLCKSYVVMPLKSRAFDAHSYMKFAIGICGVPNEVQPTGRTASPQELPTAAEHTHAIV